MYQSNTITISGIHYQFVSDYISLYQSVFLFAKAVCNRKISLQEIEQSGYRNPDSVFGVLTNEIFGQNNLNDRLNLYVNLKQNRNGFKDSLVNKIVDHDKGCKILADERVSASDGNEPLVIHIVSALTNNDESPIQEA